MLKWEYLSKEYHFIPEIANSLLIRIAIGIMSSGLSFFTIGLAISGIFFDWEVAWQVIMVPIITFILMLVVPPALMRNSVYYQLHSRDQRQAINLFLDLSPEARKGLPSTRTFCKALRSAGKPQAYQIAENIRAVHEADVRKQEVLKRVAGPTDDELAMQHFIERLQTRKADIEMEAKTYEELM